MASTHARDQHHAVEVAVKQDGTILAIKDRILVDVGARFTSRAHLPAVVTAYMLPGPYQVPKTAVTLRSTVTNKTPLGAYHGFGRPEATRVMERMMDMVAAELGMDPVEVRRRNLLQPEQLPGYQTATGVRYDSGNYPAALERALQVLGYDEWRARQSEARAQGSVLGVGIALELDLTGLGPSWYMAQVGLPVPAHETIRVEIDPAGGTTVFSGITPIGQGTLTTLAQLAASALGVNPDDVRVVCGDTLACPYSGMATAASRGAAVGGTALILACQQLQSKIRRIAAHLLEAAEEDIEVRSGSIFVRGLSHPQLSLREVARVAYLGADLPEGMRPGLYALETFDPPALAFSFAAHACVVRIDRETGQVTVERYVVVHDCGQVINPAIVEGQLVGGIAQGLGEALMEELVYNEQTGQLLTTSLKDYLLPLAADVPAITVEHQATPTPHNPLGVKGAGESGIIGSRAAIENAIYDALHGVTARGSLDTGPLRPERVWRLLSQVDRESLPKSESRAPPLHAR